MSQVIAGAVGGFGFSIVFGVRKRYIWLIALNAGLSWWVYLICNQLMGNFGGNIVSAAFCSLFAAVTARFVGAPAAVLQMPATVPMIPGGSLFYTMYYAFTGNWEQFFQYFRGTFRAIFGMAIGFAAVAVVLKKYGGELTVHVDRIKSAFRMRGKIS